MTLNQQDMVNLARWFQAEGGTLHDFIDALERPDRWAAEIAAARLLASLDLGDGGAS